MDYEKLGLFYLGRRYDAATRQRTAEPLLYDSSDLLTHAVCIGMTGSGKTGLGIALIEEAAIDGLPVLAIDPKGDLANLALRFPGLSAPEFAPWVNPDEARAQQIDAGGLRRRRSGALDGRPRRLGPGRRPHRPAGRRRRRRRLHPGQPRRTAAVDSRDVQPAAARRFSTSPSCSPRACSRWPRACCRWPASTATPTTSREHVLVATLLQEAWRAGRDLDLAVAHRPGAVAADGQGGRARPRVVLPRHRPLRAGDAAQQRAGRARLRRLARGRARSTSAKLLYTADGQGRASRSSRSRTSATPSACSSWRCCSSRCWPGCAAQRGTTSLRAVLYMDEVFGFLPPTRQPAEQGAAADAAQAGARLRPRLRARDAEPGRPRLQGAGQRRHVVPRPAADRARQGARARRARGRGVGLGPGLRSRGARHAAVEPRQARVPAAQRARPARRCCSRRAGRCRICAGRWGATRSAR